jgi:hypothetical protein
MNGKGQINIRCIRQKQWKHAKNRQVDVYNLYWLLVRAVIAQSIWSWATGWTIGVLGFDFRWGLGDILFTTASRTALELTLPPIPWVPVALSVRVKRPGREATTHLHLVPRSNNAWSCTSTPQYAFMAWCSVKAQGHLYLYWLLVAAAAVDMVHCAKVNEKTNKIKSQHKKDQEKTKTKFRVIKRCKHSEKWNSDTKDKGEE